MLTDPKCRNAAPKAAVYRLADARGLALEVRTTGKKAWIYRFRLNGKQNIATLGSYPDLSLKDARAARDRAAGLVAQGINPNAAARLERIQRAQTAEQTVDAVTREWINARRDQGDWSEETAARCLSLFESRVFPVIGRLPVGDVKPAHILDVLKKTGKDTLTQAALIRRRLSGVFAYAVSTLRAESDPTWPLRDAIPKNKTQHKRPLTPQEIGQLLRDWRDRESFTHVTRAAFHLMFYTGARINEVTSAEWLDFDLDALTWTVPDERMKMSRAQTFAIPTQAAAMLKSIKPLTGHRRHVFPHRDERDEPMTTARIRGCLNALGWGGRFSPHATRATFSTTLHEMGHPSEYIEAQLAHVDKNSVRRSYNAATHLEARKKMVQAWADYCDSLRDGAEVVPIRSGKTA